MARSYAAYTKESAGEPHSTCIADQALNILIIDDNPDDREKYVRSLRKVPNSSYIFAEADDGNSGIQIASSQKCDCVLLDYSLPGMNGIAVLKALRSVFPYLPVIVFTGQGNEEVAVQAIKEGAFDYLNKSACNSERLYHTIQSAIHQSALMRGLAEKDAQIEEKTAALALSEQRYELAVQGLSVGVWDWNVPTNDLYWSPRFKEIIGCVDEELPDRYEEWESRLHPDDHARVVKMLFGHLEKKGPYDVEYRLRRKDGSYAWIHAKGLAVWDEEEKPTRMVGSIEDITWRKEAAAERENIITRLTESNSELERFAYACSHDLQEPLRMIANFSERLEKHLGDSLDDKGRHYMKYIIDGAVQARQLIHDVLNYARIDHETECLANVESEKTLGGVLRDLSARIEETGAVITHDTLPEVSIQPTHLRQLLQNLIGNALKFCAENPRVDVGASPEGGMWKFYVRDNGIGIPEEHLQRIFIIFQRLHSRERYPGTGIGLALCKKLVQKYGGRIWVESQAGQGSTFYFTLPAATETQSRAA